MGNFQHHHIICQRPEHLPTAGTKIGVGMPIRSDMPPGRRNGLSFVHGDACMLEQTHTCSWSLLEVPLELIVERCYRCQCTYVTNAQHCAEPSYVSYGCSLERIPMHIH